MEKRHKKEIEQVQKESVVSIEQEVETKKSNIWGIIGKVFILILALFVVALIIVMIMKKVNG